MNSLAKMAEVRNTFSLPEPGAAHECSAVQAGTDERSKRLGTPHDCYAGQWALHGPHDFELRVQKWLGGGSVMVHCPGKTEATVLG